MRIGVFASFAFVSAIAASSTNARAYCRTTTDKESAGYDPSVSGCWPTGAPLAWHANEIGYSLVAAASTAVSYADANAALANAFLKWTTAACSVNNPTNHPNLKLIDEGPADSASMDCGLIECDATVHDPNHLIVFRDDAWPHNDPNNTLALTTVTFGVNSGEIFDADMEINSFGFKLSVASPTPPGSFDLETILTHETGHFLGMAHSDHASAVMYVRYASGRTALTQDDISAICTVYPEQATSSTAGCACGIAASKAANGAAGAAMMGGAAMLAITIGRRRRRRR